MTLVKHYDGGGAHVAHNQRYYLVAGWIMSNTTDRLEVTRGFVGRGECEMEKKEKSEIERKNVVCLCTCIRVCVCVCMCVSMCITRGRRTTEQKRMEWKNGIREKNRRER